MLAASATFLAAPQINRPRRSIKVQLTLNGNGKSLGPTSTLLFLLVQDYIELYLMDLFQAPGPGGKFASRESRIYL